jgi:hypothetical protein
MARARTLARRRTEPLYVVADWSRGIVRDASRTALPESAVYDSADYLLHRPGIAEKRGGTAYAGPAMTGGAYAAAVAVAPFASGTKLIGISESGHAHMYEIAAGATTDRATLGTGFPPVDNPKFRLDTLVIPASNGTTAPQKAYISAGTLAATALGGSPPAGKFCEIYRTRVVLGGTSANPNRSFFSPTPNIEGTWDTTNSFIDHDQAISGYAALHNALLIFTEGTTERIVGSTPPPGSDMDRARVGSVGCTDARSIIVRENNAIFANQDGVWLTNGAGFASLTTEGGIESYWQSLLSSYDKASWSIAASTFRSFYVVTILNGATLVATLMCNVPRRAWWRVTNIKALMYAQAVGVQSELYYADRATNRVTKVSGIFSPSSSNKNDADGTAVTPSMELKLIGSGPGLKHFGFGRLSYDMRDAATDNPTLAVTVAPGLEATTYTAVSESPFAENTDNERKRFTVAKVSQAVNVKLVQANASSKTELYALEVEQRPLPGVAGGQ